MAQQYSVGLSIKRSRVRSMVRETENAGVENMIRAKLQGCKIQEWKKQYR